MIEARNLRNLIAQQTPLLGDENTPLHSIPGRGTGFEGATPRNNFAGTPNPLATPLRQDAYDPSGQTPRTDAAGATPLRTPLRDNLSINQVDGTPYSVAATPRDEKMRLLQAKQKLKTGFMNLPAPKNDFELVDPTEAALTEEEKAQRVEDRAEADARNAAQIAEEDRLKLERRSSAVKRSLPRPVDLDVSSLLASLQVAVDEPTLELDRQVTIEMLSLLDHDSIVHPVPGSSIVGGLQSTLPHLSDESLIAARALVHGELAQALGFPGASEETVRRTIYASVDLADFDAVWQPHLESRAFDPTSKTYVDRSQLTDDQYLAGLTSLIEGNRTSMMREAEKAQKSEMKLGKTLGGYNARSKALAKKLGDSYGALDAARVQYNSFQALSDLENGASTVPLLVNNHILTPCSASTS